MDGHSQALEVRYLPMESKLNGRNLLYLALSLIASAVIGGIAFSLIGGLPSFDDATCQGQHASGCMEWSLVLFGPLYLGFYLLIYGVAITMTLAPVAFGLALIFRGKKTIHGGGTDA